MPADPTRPMDGRVVLVTGGNAGVGLETAVGLAGLGARVVITARDPDRGARAAAEIRTRTGREVEVMPLDLADGASIRAGAAWILEAHERLDVLVANAGLVQRHRTETVDGFETTFGVNHLGHFLLTTLLLDRLLESAPSRVVVVASHAHKQARTGLDFSDLQSERRYRPMTAYARSKLANILFTRELARRLAGAAVTANALHPGFVASRLGRDGDGGPLATAAMVAGRPFAVSPARGAQTSIFLASDPGVGGVSGGYWAKCRPSTPSPAARDHAAAARLWAVSEELVAGIGSR